MDLGCLDLGCLSLSEKRNGAVGVTNPLESSSSPSPSSSSATKSGQKKSPRENSSLRKSQSKRSSLQRKTSPLGWFPRRKGDSYLNRKIKKLQEVGGMKETLDETLGDTNPHYCKIVREQMAVREAAGKAMELRKAALVEASWCRILQAARVPSLDAETLMDNAEKAALEAFEAASAMGVIIHDKPNSSRKQYRIQTSGTRGGGSPTHTVTASFETAFDVDKEVAASVKAAFARLENCPSLTEDLLRKISENPDVRDTNHEITEVSSECDTESDSELGALQKVDEEVEETSYFKMRQLKVKRRQSFGKLSREKLVDIILERLQGLQEEQLSSIASIVAACGLNEALAEVDSQRPQTTTSIEPTVSDHASLRRGSKFGCVMEGKATRDVKETEILSLDKYLVKHMSKLEKEVYEAKQASKNVSDKDRNVPQGVVVSDTVPDLGSVLVKHSSRLEKEIEEAKKNSGKEVQETIKNCGKMYENVKKPDKSDNTEAVASLSEVLVKHVSKLEKEVQEAKKRSKEDLEARILEPVSSVSTTEESGKENIDSNTKDGRGDKLFVKPVQQRKQEAKSESDYESLDKVFVKHVPKLEKQKIRFNNEGPESTKVVKPNLTRRQVRDREIQETWAGLGLGEIKNNNEKKPESKKTEEADDGKTRPMILNRRQAREKEMLEAWGGLGLGNSIKPSQSKLEREKAAWKAEEEKITNVN
ncbi:unnamed protein product [Cochlearia groenlandica]